MKKTYIKPTIETLNISTQHFIAMSMTLNDEQAPGGTEAMSLEEGILFGGFFSNH